MTTDEGRELLCNIQGPIAARLIAISQARFAAGVYRTSYQFFGDLLAWFAVLPTACRKWPGPPPSRKGKDSYFRYDPGRVEESVRASAGELLKSGERALATLKAQAGKGASQKDA